MANALRPHSFIATASLGAWLLGFAACQAPVPLTAGTPKQVVAKSPPGATPKPAERPRVASIALGHDHTCALFTNGALRCWGEARLGALGNPNPTNIGDDEAAATAPAVALGEPAKAVAAGATHTCALLESGQVKCWGRWHSLGFARPAGSQGQLDNSFVGPTGIDAGAPLVELAAGFSHTCGRLVEGPIRCWGRNERGQVGYGINFQNDSGLPPRVLGNVPIAGPARRIWAGENGSCALLENESLSCWGEPWVAYGRDRTQRIKSQSTPAVVDVGGRAKQVVFGASHACALLEDGSIRCWGEGVGMGHGNTEIGDDEPPSAVRPLDVGGKAIALAAGSFHTCALLDSGGVRCWGRSESGELGYGNRVDVGDDEAPATAGDVPVGGKAVQIAAGGFHTCALLESGALRCWGDGREGALGYGNTASIGDRITPAEAGDVPLFADRRPSQAPAEPNAKRTVTGTEVPLSWDAPAPGPPQAACGEPCAGCRSLYDSSNPPKHDAAPLTEQESARVLDVYKQYINSDRCLSDERHLDPLAIGSAQDNGRVSDVLAGAFTEAGRKQKLVLFFAGHCGELGSHSENWGERLLILLENQTARRASVEPSTSSLAALDLNNDGRSELVTWGGWAGGGGHRSWLAVKSYAGGVQTLWATFPELDSSTCSPGNPDGQQINAKVLYRWSAATQAVCFQERKHSSACRKR